MGGFPYLVLLVSLRHCSNVPEASSLDAPHPRPSRPSTSSDLKTSASCWSPALLLQKVDDSDSVKTSDHSKQALPALPFSQSDFSQTNHGRFGLSATPQSSRENHCRLSSGCRVAPIETGPIPIPAHLAVDLS